MRENPLFKLVIGVNGPRLGTKHDSVPSQLGALPPEIEAGVIAGNYTINPLFSSWIGSANDGRVSTASTRIDGMRDHIVMPYMHTTMLMRAQAISQIVHFLENGRFDHAA